MNMKAFKGCVNEECSAYKKVRYKDVDAYCSKCGNQIYYVCADCWKQLENNKSRFCTSCEMIRKDKRDQRIANIQDGVNKFGGLAVAIGGSAAAVVKNIKKVEGAAKEVGKLAKGAIKIIPKKFK